MMKKIFLGIAVLMFMAACNQPKSNGEQENMPADTTAVELSSVKMAVSGMTCEGCEKTVETRLAKIEGVAEALASHVDSSVVVKYDASKVELSELTAAVDKSGYKVIE